MLQRSSFLARVALLAGASACSDGSGQPDRTATGPDRADPLERGAIETASDAEATRIALDPMLAQVAPGTADPGLGGQTGDDNALGQIECTRISSTPLDLDAPSPLGFVPRDSAALALGPRQLSLRWQGGDESGMPETETELHLDIELSTDQAELIHHQEVSPYPGVCGDIIEVAVGIDLETSDSRLRKHVDGRLQLLADRALLNSVTAPGFLLDGIFTRYGTQGVLGTNYEAGNAGGLEGGARWPAWDSLAGMCIQGVPVLRDDLQPSVDDVLARVRGANPIRIVDATGSESQGTLALTAVERTACFVSGVGNWGEIDGVTDLLMVDVELELQSAARPSALRLPARLSAEFARKTGTMYVTLDVSTWCGTSASLNPEDFIRQCGDWGAALTGYDRVFLETRESRFGAGPGFAEFRIRGARAPGCVPDPMGVSCAAGSRAQSELVDIADVSFFSP